ncbi:MAG: DUF1552 domain-containing protein [Planctomycetales bacterium]|nr:DUF1552 domain-containing protein [Planctomycetales bacterium]
MARVLARRSFLRESGIALALPLLDAMQPAFGADKEPVTPRRLVAIETNMGILPQFFFPEAAGGNYELSPYLQQLAMHRERMTVFSGVSLPGVDGAHAAEKCFLTGTPHPTRGGFKNGISLDQFAADHVGSQTRFPSLALAMSNENPTLSFTRSGAPIPAEKSPRQLFERLFLQGDPREVAATVMHLQDGRSMLDFLGEQTSKLQRSLPAEDRRRMDQYLSSVRELERRMQAAEAWQHRPKPTVEAKAPEENNDRNAFVERSATMFDMIKLAIETDSTRIVSLFIDTTVIHNITHHGFRPETIAELKGHEMRQFDALNGLLTALADTAESGESLLDRTMVLYGTCMGSANSHSNVNLPVLLAGGGFRHGQHLAFDQENNYPLSNLYLSMLHRLGIEANSFSTSTGTMRGLELLG